MVYLEKLVVNTNFLSCIPSFLICGINPVPLHREFLSQTSCDKVPMSN